MGLEKRGTLVLGAILSAALAMSGVLPAFAGESHQFDVPVEDASSAIRDFASQAHVQILVSGENVKDKRLHAVSGEFSTDQGLRLLLADSGLSPKYVGDRSIAIVAASTLNAGSATTGDQPVSAGAVLEEVLVTAQKREERLQDVPVPVTVLDVQSLFANSQARIQDYFAQVPGLSLSSEGAGYQSLAIRGITTGAFANPTVGISIDDVPFGSTSTLGNGNQLYPDIDPSDLARIEVLRGPQGTLYGADSIGGLIKFVTLDPSTEGLSGSMQALGDYVEHGELGYGFRGSVNVPLSDVLAVRASGFARRDPGYITNITTGQRDVNQVDVEGGHLAALLHLGDVTSVKISALLQNTNGSGSSLIDINSQGQQTLSDLQQTGLSGTGSYTAEIRLYSATIKSAIAGVDIVSVSGYGINTHNTITDLTDGFGGFAKQYFGVSGTTSPTDWQTEKFTQEIRLSSHEPDMIEWLSGAFYSHEYSLEDQSAVANVVPSGSPVGTLIHWHDAPAKVEEYSLFGDLTFHFSDRFSLQVGGRESEYRQTYDETDTGLLVPLFDGVASSPYVQPQESKDGNAFTYLFTPQFKISNDLMVYGRATSGYRMGGVNIEAQAGEVPLSFGPDKTNDYELGVKGEVLDNRLTFDGSVYRIDWKKIQIELYAPTFAAYFANGGNARSQGVELSLQAHPTQALSISTMVSLDDAKLTQNFPAASTAFGLAGDRLPYSSRVSGNASATQDVLHIGIFTGFIGADASYVGAREGNFVGSATQSRLTLPAYTDVNLHAGARSTTWSFNGFVNNVADRRGFVGGSNFPAIGSPGYYAALIQPRTLGVSISRQF